MKETSLKPVIEKLESLESSYDTFEEAKDSLDDVISSLEEATE